MDERVVQRVRVQIEGAVQGVGFRPFVYRLATELGLTGSVSNSAQGVTVEAEGSPEKLSELVARITAERPPRSSIAELDVSACEPLGSTAFTVTQSEDAGEKRALVLPDIATCPGCLREIADPANRRHRYPFTNCTNCGPRYSIIEALPYDRAKTTMKTFTMCPACQAEYDDPRDRRFHAQPSACPVCGPRLALWTADGTILEDGHEALLAAVEAIRGGAIIAVKGVGGFHLMADARNEEAVQRLRRRKAREEKPLALMFPTLRDVRTCCLVSPEEEELLLSPEAPIVLLKRRTSRDASTPEIASSVAPRNPYLGLMLPYTPLHHLLMAEIGGPVVATSGNRSDEPICIDESEALDRLGKIADLFLVHNRPIARQVDDSVARVVMGRIMVTRRSRGFAPHPVKVPAPLPPVLGVGGHLKSTVALSVGRDIFISQHIGDLDTEEAATAYRQTAASLAQLYDFHPAAVACDAHPDYHSTRFAAQFGVPVISVQHHYAHVLACMAEHGLDGPLLGVAWDGTGYGLDRTVWGGEFLYVSEKTFDRVAHLRTFRLPGGERATKEPRRAALGVLHEIFGDSLFETERCLTVQAFSPLEKATLRRVLERQVNAPLTSSAGRLFDAVASMTGLRQRVVFEGQAAMELEFALDEVETDEAYEIWLQEEEGSLVVDWEPMIRGVIHDVQEGTAIGMISAKFHNALAGTPVAVARRTGATRVVLTGGCFQNRYLLERTVQALEAAHIQVYWSERVPANDGGIALGQVVGAGKAFAAWKEER